MSQKTDPETERAYTIFTSAGYGSEIAAELAKAVVVISDNSVVTVDDAIEFIINSDLGQRAEYHYPVRKQH